MIKILKQEKKLYFPTKKRFYRCMIFHEHEYEIWKFVRLLRLEEHSNGIIKYLYGRKKNKLGSKLGFMIPAGVFSEGLLIYHYGNIIINGYSKVGKNCILHGDNCIGNDGIEPDKAPCIGDNVDIGVGAKIIGDIKIANNITIGAGAVVVNSFDEEGIVIAGIPAKKIK